MSCVSENLCETEVQTLSQSCKKSFESLIETSYRSIQKFDYQREDENWRGTKLHWWNVSQIKTEMTSQASAVYAMQAIDPCFQIGLIAWVIHQRGLQ